MRGILDSIATRLDEARDISRYMTGLLVFLGLLGTFWGLIETVLGRLGHSGTQRQTATADPCSIRCATACCAALRHGHFVLVVAIWSGSLVLGFLDLQSSQAQNRFYTELEDWLSTTVYDQAAEPALGAGVGGEVRSAIERLRGAVDQFEAESRPPLPWRISPRRFRAGPSYAHRTADDPRLGRLAGRPATRDQEAAGGSGARTRKVELSDGVGTNPPQ